MPTLGLTLQSIFFTRNDMCQPFAFAYVFAPVIRHPLRDWGWAHSAGRYQFGRGA